MNQPQTGRHFAPPRAVANLCLAAAAGGAAVLYRFPPQDYSFYPRCPFFALTHHYCPGCGATRAMAELLHGHVSAALHFNAAATLLVPLALCYFAVMYWTAVRENRIEWPALPGWAWKASLASLLLFGIMRAFTQNTL